MDELKCLRVLMKARAGFQEWASIRGVEETDVRLQRSRSRKDHVLERSFFK